jgi:hypothetical protein
LFMDFQASLLSVPFLVGKGLGMGFYWVLTLQTYTPFLRILIHLRHKKGIIFRDFVQLFAVK